MGWDYSGTIVAVGDKLKGKWEVGDEVWGICDGPVGGTFLHSNCRAWESVG